MPEKMPPAKNAAPPSAPPPWTLRLDKLLREFPKMPRAELHARMEAVLTRGLHWEVVNKHPALSPQGAALLRENIHRPLATPQRGPRPVAGLLGPVVYKGELIAWKAPERNEKLLIAYIPGTDPENPHNLVNVQVRSNRHFTRGMRVKNARQTGRISFEVSGPMPRFRGKY